MTGSPDDRRFASDLREADERLLRRAIALARFARTRANGPYGAIIARNGFVVVEGENTEQEANGDLTSHAEMNALRQILREVPSSGLGDLTLYASTEPCPMCSGAIALSGIRRVVYGASAQKAADVTGSKVTAGCRWLLAEAAPHVEVVGPLIEDEALAVLR